MKLKGKKVLVTGGGGFIGSHLTHRLLDEGARVSIVTKYNSVVDNVRLADVWDRLDVIEADIRNLDALRPLKRLKPDVVFHLAAYNHVGDSFSKYAEAMDSNGTGTANLVETLDGYEKFVYVSSSEVYGYQDRVPFREDFCPKPISPYAIGKFAGDLFCQIKQSNGYPIAIIRPFNTFGPYQTMRAIIPELIVRCLRGKDIVTTEGKQTREFNFVSNIVDGFLLAATTAASSGKIINVGAGEEIRIRDLILTIHKMTDSSSKLFIGKLPYRPTEIWRMCTSNERARKILKWKPAILFREGLKRTIAWYRDFLAVYHDPRSPLCRLAGWNR
jgi:nucleoside-diphosphate-sugar epimerase